MTDEVKEQMCIVAREEDILKRDILDAIRKHNVPYYRLKETMEEIIGDIGDFVQINKDSVTEEIYPYIPTDNQD